METKKKISFLFIIFFFVLSLSSSAHARQQGIYHKVKKGESLYRISVAYKVPIIRIMEANGIRTTAPLKVGQKLFIPGARTKAKVQPFVSLTPKEKIDLERSLETEEKPFPPEPSPGSPAPVPGTPPWQGKELDIIWPIEGKINSPFGQRNKRLHAGIDIASPFYQEVKAAMDGEVLLAAETRSGYGNVVVLRHDRGYVTIYGHMSVIISKAGETVRQGQAIGGVGSTGKSTGPHLHFEVRHDGRPIDPMTVLPMTLDEFLEQKIKN